MDYKTANDMLAGRNKDRKKLANNTYLVRRAEGVIAVCLHATDVLRYYPSGAVQYDSGGWRTPTTKDRMNTYGPEGVGIYQAKGEWTIAKRETCPACGGHHEDNGTCAHCDYGTITAWTAPFADGMIIGPRGRPSIMTMRHATAEANRKARTRKALKAYVKAYADAFMRGEVEKPSAGDCLYCGLHGKDGKSLGDMGASDHLESHMKERYFVPSLLANALEETGASIMVKGTVGTIWRGGKADEHWANLVHRDIKAALATYMARRLGVSAPRYGRA